MATLTAEQLENLLSTYHPSERAAMREQYLAKTQQAKAEIVLSAAYLSGYAVQYPCGRVEECANLATARYLVRKANSGQ